MELSQDIQHTSLSPFAFNYFHGSPIMSMYPYISLVPMIIILFITSSIIRSYYYYYCLIIFISLLMSFLSSLKLSKSWKISYLFSIAYSVSSTFFFEMFSNGDLGVITSLIFLPVVIFGFIEILCGYNSYIKLSLGLTGMAYCQIPSTIIVILFLAVWILINIKSINLKKIICLIHVAIIVILLTSIIWISILYFLITNKMHMVEKINIVGAGPEYFFENLSFIPVISILFLLLYYSKFNRLEKQMYVLSIIICFISSKFMPWHFITHFFAFFNQFQFAFRFLIIPQCILCYLFSKSFIRYFSHKEAVIICLIIFILFIQLFTQCFILNRKENATDLNSNSHGGTKIINVLNNSSNVHYFVNGYFINSDYYPQDALPERSHIHKNEAINNYNRAIKIKHVGYNEFYLNSRKDCNDNLALPIVIYNNEHLHIYVNNKQVRYYMNKYNMLTLNHIKKGKNKILVKYIPNYTLIIIKILSFSMGLLLVLANIIKRFIYKKEVIE